MPGKDQGFDTKNLAFELSARIWNGFLFNLLTQPETTNSQLYARAGGGIICMDCARKSKIVAIDFFVASGILGADGLEIQLLDVTNGAEIVLVNFIGGEDNSIKSADVNPYLQNITGAIEIEVNIRKTGPIGPSTFNTATLQPRGLY